jgi:hypothetical protein
MRILRSSTFALMLGAAALGSFAPAARAQIAIGVSVSIAPPPLPYYEQPVIPAEGYIWAPGYWAWDPTVDDYYWVPGTWVEPPQPELLWTPGYWGWADGQYAFFPGYWGREVGFYGGIDYGYGYTGDGYFGGRWDHGVFFYNRSVNNIENARITNIYNQTVVVNRTVNNVSFNGGNGGVTARPTPQQEAFAKERHVEATPMQRQQVEAASKNRALFSKQNHGEPTVAATSRAGVFEGAGVSRGSRNPVAARTTEPEARPGEPPKANEPPKAGEPRANEPPRTERPPVEAPKAEAKPDERRPAEEARPEERRPPQEPPRAEAPRPPAEPKTEMKPPPRPAGPPPGRPGEEKKRE